MRVYGSRFLYAVVAAVFLFALVVPYSFAALSDVNTSPGADDTYEINNMTPGSSKTFLGTRLRGILAQGSTTYGISGNSSAAPIPPNVAATTPTTTVFLKTTGGAGTVGGEWYYLGNTYPGYELTVVLVTDGGSNFYVTPQTASGFTNVQLDDAKDSCTLKYINSTVGYVVKGNAGCTIN